MESRTSDYTGVVRKRYALVLAIAHAAVSHVLSLDPDASTTLNGGHEYVYVLKLSIRTWADGAGARRRINLIYMTCGAYKVELLRPDGSTAGSWDLKDWLESPRSHTIGAVFYSDQGEKLAVLAAAYAELVQLFSGTQDPMVPAIGDTDCKADLPESIATIQLCRSAMWASFDGKLLAIVSGCKPASARIDFCPFIKTCGNGKLT